MTTILWFTILISFLATLIITPHWIRRAHAEGLKGKDMHKLDKRDVAEAGGIGVLAGFVIGVFVYIAIKTFIYHDSSQLIEVFALLGVLFLASMIGVVDDLLGWKRGLGKKVRIVLMLFAAIPLMVLNVGSSNILGLEIGLLFPLIVIPLGVIGATTTFNTLAGYNGLEAGQGILILGALSIVTFVTGNPWLSVIGLCMVGALLAFYYYNKHPAKVFPGDMMTYSIGALIACMAILGNVEKIALFFFIPYILEAILKLRGRLKKESFAKVNLDGSLDMPYDKIYGLEHVAIWVLKRVKPSGKVREKDVTNLIHGFMVILIILGFLIFYT